MTEPSTILLPVGGIEDHRAGVEFAAQEAVRRRCDIDVVHVSVPTDPGLPVASDVGLVDARLTHLGETAVGWAVEAARHALRDSGLSVRGRLTHGAVVPALVECSRRAALVVLTRRHARGAASLSAMSVANGLAARAHAPVAVVPPGWSPGTTRAPLVIGVGGGGEESHHTVRAGLSHARRCGARVELVHGWWYSDAYDDLAFAGAGDREETARQHQHLAADLAPILAEFADVEANLAIGHGQPSHVLLAAAERAQLLVVGRHRPLLPFGPRLGPVTRAVLRDAACPVLVMGSPAHAGPAGDASRA